MESLPQGQPVRDGFSGAAGPRCEEVLVRSVVEAANDTRIAQLARTIETEIIPRLMLAHRVDAPEPAPSAIATASPEPIGDLDVERFAKLVLGAQEGLAYDAVLAYRARGVATERLYLDLLAPTARYLGYLWTEDLCNFTDVTVGLGRLQRILRELSPAFGRAVEHPADGRRVLLLPSPGEQHTFGLVMVGEFFRRAGWDVSGGAWTEGTQAATLVAAEWFDVVGFSLGAEIHLGALAESIRAARRASRNPDITVLVGGPLFANNPDYARKVGADAMATDGREAPVLAERFVASRAAGSIGSAARVALRPPAP